MKCNDYLDKLSTIKSVNELNNEEKIHAQECEACKHKTEEYASFLTLIEKEKQSTISPFIATRIMAKIEQPVKQPLFHMPAFATAAAITITLLLGFASGYIFDNSNNIDEQEELFSQYFSSSSIGYHLENNWLNNDLYEK